MNTIPKNYIFNLLLFFVVLLGVVFLSGNAEAGVIKQQINFSSARSNIGDPDLSSSGSSLPTYPGVALFKQELGTGLMGSVATTSFYLAINQGLGSAPGLKLAYLCFDTASNSAGNFNATCSSSEVDITIQNRNDSKTLYEITGLTFSFNPDKYYSLIIRCNSACGGGGAGTNDEIRIYGVASAGNDTYTGGDFQNDYKDDLNIKDIYFRITDTLTSSDNVTLDYPAAGTTVPTFKNFTASYYYTNSFYNTWNNRKFVVLISVDGGINYTYEFEREFFNYSQAGTYTIPLPIDLGYGTFTAKVEFYINDELIDTSTPQEFIISSVLVPEDSENPFDVFAPSSASLQLGKLTAVSASISGQFCGEIFQDSDSFLGAGIAYGICRAGSFMFSPSAYSVNFVKGQLYRVAVSFPFDYITTGYEMATTVLTDDFIASSSNSSISLGFSVDFRGLDTSAESSRSFGTGSFALLGSQSFNDMGGLGRSMMPLISTIRTIMVAMLWLTYISGVIYMVSQYFNPKNSA